MGRKMHKIGDVSTPGDGHSYAESLEAAHRLIQKLAGHIGDLTARLNSHAAKLASHGDMHSEHSRVHGQHDQRLRAVEAAVGQPSPHPTYEVTKDQLRAMGRQFKENLRNAR